MVEIIMIAVQLSLLHGDNLITRDVLPQKTYDN